MPPEISALQGLFQRIFSSLIALGGIVLFVMLVMGGVKYITSGGDPKAAEGAKNTITYAVIGLALVLAAYLILVLIKTITGANVTQFNIVQP